MCCACGTKIFSRSKGSIILRVSARDMWLRSCINRQHAFVRAISTCKVPLDSHTGLFCLYGCIIPTGTSMTTVLGCSNATAVFIVHHRSKWMLHKAVRVQKQAALYKHVLHRKLRSQTSGTILTKIGSLLTKPVPERPAVWAFPSN
jgi:hypothetical protein